MAVSTIRKTLLADITRSYSPVESWLFDHVVADSARTMSRSLVAVVRDIALRGGSILDIGCGGGHLARDLARSFPDVRVTGIDASPEQIGRARRRAEGFGGRLEFRWALAGALPFDDGTFDAVVSGGSLKHWADRPAGLAEALRVARPGAVLAVGDLDRGCSLADARAFASTWRMPSVAREIGVMVFRTYAAGQSLDADEFRRLARDSDLEDIAVERLPGLPSLLLTGRKPGSA